MYLKGLKLEVALHSIHREYKKVQKSVLTNVNIQRTGKTSLQMFVYFIFDGNFICRFLYIFRPSSVPPHSICPPWLDVYTLIINDLYLQILHSASESRTWKQEKTNRNTTAYCIENQRLAEAKPTFLTTAQTLFLHCVHIWLSIC